MNTSHTESLGSTASDIRELTLVVSKNVINLFEKPDTSSDVVTQSICGALLRMEKQESGFAFVEGEDRYRGWADLRHVVPHDASSMTSSPGQNASQVTTLLADVYSGPNQSSELLTKLVISTPIICQSKSSQADQDLIQIELPDQSFGWTARNSVTKHTATLSAVEWKTTDTEGRGKLVKLLGERVVEIGMRFIGVPYLWGGCTPFGIDCSGLVQLAYKLEGIQLLRDADIQFGDRRFVKVEEGNSFEQAKFAAGDLVVFGTKGSITHIGLAIGDGRFLHASGRARNFGTYINHCTDQYWTGLYMGAVRLSASANLSVDEA